MDTAFFVRSEMPTSFRSGKSDENGLMVDATAEPSGNGWALNAAVILYSLTAVFVFQKNDRVAQHTGAKMVPSGGQHPLRLKHLLLYVSLITAVEVDAAGNGLKPIPTSVLKAVDTAEATAEADTAPPFLHSEDEKNMMDTAPTAKGDTAAPQFYRLKEDEGDEASSYSPEPAVLPPAPWARDHPSQQLRRRRRTAFSYFARFSFSSFRSFSTPGMTPRPSPYPTARTFS